MRILMKRRRFWLDLNEIPEDWELEAAIKLSKKEIEVSIEPNIGKNSLIEEPLEARIEQEKIEIDESLILSSDASQKNIPANQPIETGSPGKKWSNFIEELLKQKPQLHPSVPDYVVYSLDLKKYSISTLKYQAHLLRKKLGSKKSVVYQENHNLLIVHQAALKSYLEKTREESINLAAEPAAPLLTEQLLDKKIKSPSRLDENYISKLRQKTAFRYPGSKDEVIFEFDAEKECISASNNYGSATRHALISLNIDTNKVYCINKVNFLVIEINALNAIFKQRNYEPLSNIQEATPALIQKLQTCSHKKRRFSNAASVVTTVTTTSSKVDENVDLSEKEISTIPTQDTLILDAQDTVEVNQIAPLRTTVKESIVKTPSYQNTAISKEEAAFLKALKTTVYEFQKHLSLSQRKGLVGEVLASASEKISVDLAPAFERILSASNLSTISAEVASYKEAVTNLGNQTEKHFPSLYIATLKPLINQINSLEESRSLSR